MSLSPGRVQGTGWDQLSGPSQTGQAGLGDPGLGRVHTESGVSREPEAERDFHCHRPGAGAWDFPPLLLPGAQIGGSL